MVVDETPSFLIRYMRGQNEPMCHRGKLSMARWGLVVGSLALVAPPAERYGAIYRGARAALASLVDTTRLGPRGDLRPPVRVRFTGAAFFDGFHQRAAPGGTLHADQHGRCNSSLRALWELHPVYGVTAPG